MLHLFAILHVRFGVAVPARVKGVIPPVAAFENGARADAVILIGFVVEVALDDAPLIFPLGIIFRAEQIPGMKIALVPAARVVDIVHVEIFAVIKGNGVARVPFGGFGK